MITYESIKKNETIRTYITRADESLAVLGYTEHSFPHVCHVAEMAGYILETLGYDARSAELARIAGFLHDIGNLVNRSEHSQSGAVMAWTLLHDMGCDPGEQATIVTAIGNHDEGTGVPVNAVAAALILADKADVRRSRVRQLLPDPHFDMHDRVNYSVYQSVVLVDAEHKAITMECDVDPEFSSVVEFFEAFLSRMSLCRKAAEKLGMHFHLRINNTDML